MAHNNEIFGSRRAATNRIIPGFSEFEERLAEIGNSGFAMALHVGLRRSVHVYSTYPEEWARIYEQSHLIVLDPIMAWSIVNIGTARWSEIRKSIRVPVDFVLDRAAEHGLRYGAACSIRNSAAKSRRCLLSVARSDRELTDKEIREVYDILTQIVAISDSLSGLSVSDAQTLQFLAQGMTQDEMAFTLGVSTSAIKKRVERVRLKLNARNPAHAVAIAFERGILDIELQDS